MTALITGAGRGIGAACAIALAKDGFDIILNYNKSEDAAKEVAAEIEALGRRAEIFKFDVSDSEETSFACAEILGEFGAPDVLVNNAGISVSGLIQDISDYDLGRLLDTNLKSAINLCRIFAPGMISRKSGCIINISSMWGQVGASCESVYAASKGGIDAFTKSLAKELGPSGIRVNAVSPGVIQTDMCAGYSKEELEALVAETPLGKLGAPKDVANAVSFLASKKASFITGQIVGVNGGFV